MTTFLLLRHAHSTANHAGILAGRIDGVALSPQGKAQAEALAKELRDFRVDRFISSPLLRCQATISPTARSRRKRVTLDANFIEMDYGLWSGRKLKELQKEKDWKAIQREPMSFTFPSGESFLKAASRIERGLTTLSTRYPKATILIVTHGDIIKLATQITLGGDLNKFQRLIVDTCSLTIIDWNKKERSLIRFNQKLVKIGTKVRKTSLKSRRVIGGGSGV